MSTTGPATVQVSPIWSPALYQRWDCGISRRSAMASGSTPRVAVSPPRRPLARAQVPVGAAPNTDLRFGNSKSPAFWALRTLSLMSNGNRRASRREGPPEFQEKGFSTSAGPSWLCCLQWASWLPLLLWAGLDEKMPAGLNPSAVGYLCKWSTDSPIRANAQGRLLGFSSTSRASTALSARK